jgi:hypothetical protein
LKTLIIPLCTKVGKMLKWGSKLIYKMRLQVMMMIDDDSEKLPSKLQLSNILLQVMEA